MRPLRGLLSWSVRAIAGLPGSCVCTLCGKRLTRFLPYTAGGWQPFKMPPLMQALQMIGSDVTHFSCPHCLSHDRERHLWLYLQASGLSAALSKLRILHMAPEMNLARRIEALRPACYVQGDLYPTVPGIQRIDLLAIPFDDSSFELVIANHVLEHVDDDLAALRELTRVLAPGGHAILQTPYAASLETTWFDRGVNTPAGRLHAYGQEDHVRLFGRDIFQRFASTGLEDHTQTHDDALATVDPTSRGVNRLEPFFLFRKPEYERAAAEFVD
jgi:SAM-dependent methyltransferase